MTRSMIEISTGICQDGADALAQLREALARPAKAEAALAAALSPTRVS